MPVSKDLTNTEPILFSFIVRLFMGSEVVILKKSEYGFRLFFYPFIRIYRAKESRGAATSIIISCTLGEISPPTKIAP